MGYQALLFCPDEKTARTVTQVLSELDFAVIPCTEPFAAVKKMMGEHFDAVVVDCDNEQNATLLFKSARNTLNNQSSLAVAVVEGQAGVAKAFRIGANLVLTKPINVEQAKGTLRVARGLLRKSEAAKPAAPAASTAGKHAMPLPTPPKPAPQRPIPTVATARPAAPAIPTHKPAPQPKTVASSVPTEIIEGDTELLELSEDHAPLSMALREAETAASQPEVPTPTLRAGFSPASSGGFASSAASAPAPAREPKPSVSTEHKSSTPQSQGEKVAGTRNISSVEETSAPAPTLTFGGTAGSGTEPAKSGSRKVLLAVAAVVLIAAGGYAAWTQWGPSKGTATVPLRIAAQPATAPAAGRQVAPSAVPAATSSPTSTASSIQSSTRVSAAASQPTGTARTSSDSDGEDTASGEDAPTHSSKVSPRVVSAKAPASTLPANKVPATTPAAQPIVIKNGGSQLMAKPAAASDAPAPSMSGIAAAGNGGVLPNLMDSSSKVPTPVLQTLNVSQGVSQGLLVKKAPPAYPPNALQMHIEGSVQLSATISKNGNISAVKILNGDPQLAHAAVDAVKQWKYKPYLLNGEPVEIQTQITVNFKLPH
jgi:TonB family protein